MRLIATKENPVISLDGFRREFEYWSGRAFWRNETNHHYKTAHHPGGYYRAFDVASKKWYWKNGNGNNMAWDTVPLSI